MGESGLTEGARRAKWPSGSPGRGRTGAPKAIDLLYFLFALCSIFILGFIEGRFFRSDANADAFYAYAFVQDLFESSGSFEWFVQPANGLIPDLLLTSVLFAAGIAIEDFFPIYSACYFALLFVSILFLVLTAGERLRTATSISAATLLVATFSNRGVDGLDFEMAAPAHHAGVLPLMFVSFGLVLRFLESRPMAWPLALALLTVAAAVSDPIFLLQVVLPIVLLLCLLTLTEGAAQRGLHMLFALALSANALVGLALRDLLDLVPGLQHGILGVKPQNLLDASASFVEAFPALLTFSVCAALLGPVFAGTFSEDGIVRQQIPGFVIPVLGAIWFTAIFLQRAVSKGIVDSLVAFGILSILAWACLDIARLELRDALEDYKTDSRILAEYEPGLVLAQYWGAKPLRSVSDLPVCGTTNTGSVYPWITNLGWCHDAFLDWRFFRKPFAVGGRLIWQDGVLRDFGTPDEEIETGSGKFFLFHWSAASEERIRNALCYAYGLTKPGRDPGYCRAP